MRMHGDYKLVYLPPTVAHDNSNTFSVYKNEKRMLVRNHRDNYIHCIFSIGICFLEEK